MAQSLELIAKDCCSKLKSNLLDVVSLLGKTHTLKLLNQLQPHLFGVLPLVYAQVIALVSGWG